MSTAEHFRELVTTVQHNTCIDHIDWFLEDEEFSERLFQLCRTVAGPEIAREFGHTIHAPIVSVTSAGEPLYTGGEHVYMLDQSTDEIIDPTILQYIAVPPYLKEIYFVGNVFFGQRSILRELIEREEVKIRYVFFQHATSRDSFFQSIWGNQSVYFNVNNPEEYYGYGES